MFFFLFGADITGVLIFPAAKTGLIDSFRVVVDSLDAFFFFLLWCFVAAGAILFEGPPLFGVTAVVLDLFDLTIASGTKWGFCIQ